MTDCLDFRRRIGAEPAAAGDDLERHRRDCPACARYQDELRAMDGLIARALAVDAVRITKPAPAAAADRAPPATRRLFAIAASIAVGLAVGLVLLIGGPRVSIAREVVEHVKHEPDSMTGTAPIAPAALAGVLDPEGTRLKPGVGDVTFAARCLHDGHVVPHLVVRVPEGAVTVLLLRHREIDEPIRVSEQGLDGIVLPAPRGSIAIVGQDVRDLDGVAMKIFAAVDWGA